MKYTLTITATFFIFLTTCFANNGNMSFGRSYLSLDKNKTLLKDKEIYICQLSHCINPTTGKRCLVRLKSKSSKKKYYTTPLYFLQWTNRKKTERNFYNFRTKNNENITYFTNRILNNSNMKIWCQQKECLKKSLTIIKYNWRQKLMKELMLTIKLKDNTSREMELLCAPESKKNKDLSDYE